MQVAGAVDDDAAGDLPSGTVTILFSEVEGSTRLVARMGENSLDVLEAHRELLSLAWAEWRGRVVRAAGDRFFVVFAAARDAVLAALEAQQRLAEWTSPAERLRVRIGVHTGDPMRHENDYEGIDVHRAARIASAAHGGQVLLSAVTRDLVAGRLGTGALLLDLGRHHLKDLPEAEHLYQASGEGLHETFPPPKSLGASSSLPVPPTRLVGRDGELRELRALLQLSQVRLVTLTGAGGSGKTRLAIALAAEMVESFTDGVYFVPLAAATSRDAMWTNVADALGVAGDAWDRKTLLEALQDSRMMLVLDNLEQLVDASKVVAELLGMSQELVVVATSRRPLHLQGEHEHPVPPLDLPHDATLEDSERSGAVRLFVQQAQLVRSSFELTIDNVADVATICRRLDGLPLAIELAASRMKLLSPAALVARLDGTIGLRAQDVDRPSRQQTLHATIAWSYNLLTPSLQRSFRQLGVFAGGCDLEAITAVVDPHLDPLDLVAELVDLSLLTITDGPDGEPRIMVLQTVLEFTRVRLEEVDEFDDARLRHAVHFARVAEEQAALLWSGSRQLAARDKLLVERENFAAALTWTLRPDSRIARDAELAVRLAGSLWQFWGITDRITEGRRWLDAALARPGEQDPLVRARALSAAGTLAWRQADYEIATRRHAEALALQLEAGDENGAAFSLNNVGVQALEQRDYRGAEASLDRARTMSTDSRVTAIVLLNLAEVARGLGDLPRSARCLHECIQLCSDTGEEVLWGQASINLAMVTLNLDDLPLAVDHYAEALARVQRLRDLSLVGHLLLGLAMLAHVLDDDANAARLLGAAQSLHESLAEIPSEHDARVTGSTRTGARDALGAARFTELHDEGRALSGDEAMRIGEELLAACSVQADAGVEQRVHDVDEDVRDDDRG